MLLEAVEAHVHAVLGPDAGRAGVTFLGTDRIEVLRIPAGDLMRYVTVGMSRAPMADPAATVVDPTAPRAELVLSLRRARDSVLRSLAVLAAAPAVEGLVVAPGVSLDLGSPLWDGAAFTGVLVGDPGGPVPDLVVPDLPVPVRFLPVLPLTPAESAYKRVHGAAALEEQWLRAGTDLRDPQRRQPPLEPPERPRAQP